MAFGAELKWRGQKEEKLNFPTLNVFLTKKLGPLYFLRISFDFQTHCRFCQDVQAFSLS